MISSQRRGDRSGRRFTIAWICGALAIGLCHPALAEIRCGQRLPQKEAIERRTASLDTDRFFEVVRTRLDGKFKGYAVIFTGAAGRRLGFRRAGWAIDPCEPGSRGAPFDLNTESAIGSVTKLFTTVAVLRATNDPLRLQRPMTAFLPHRWRALAHPYYDSVTIESLLRHKGGFRRSGGGEHVTSRLRKGRELETPENTRSYSNASMGIFHFIYARYAFRAPYHSTEVAHQNAPLARYNEAIQERTSHFFNVGLYNTILRPLRISASCDARVAQFPPGRPEYFPFATVARSYGGPRDGRGRLLASSARNCASGGLYLSAKDLAAFMSALDDPAFLSEPHRQRMMVGPRADLYGFWTAQPGAKGGRTLVHNGARIEGSGEDEDRSVAFVMRFASGAHAVFVANSPFGDARVQRTLIEAYDAARR